MPIRNVGSDTPSSEMVMNSWLVKVPRLRAAYTPMGTPMTRARKAATKASSSVAGKRSAISRETLAPWRRLRPNSPWAALTKKCQNCMKKGLSRPSEARSSRICSGVASWPSRNTTGSPTYWNSMKEMKATVTMTITACIRRRNIKASIGESIECSMGTPQPLLMAGRWQAICGRQTGPENKTKKARASRDDLYHSLRSVIARPRAVRCVAFLANSWAIGCKKTPCGPSRSALPQPHEGYAGHP
ncbi:hypothetical protein D3C71_894880 [compost metagenome]